MSDLARALEIAKELEFRKKTNQMAQYKPYDYQKKFLVFHPRFKLIEL